MTFLLNYTKYTAIKGVRNCETAPKLCGDFFTLTVFWSPKGILVIDKVPFCVVLVKLSQKSVYWCLRQPVAFFSWGKSLSPVTLQSVYVCRCAADVKTKCFVGGARLIEHLWCWCLKADGPLLWASGSYSISLSLSLIMQQCPRPLQDTSHHTLLRGYCDSHLLYDRHDVAWKRWHTLYPKHSFKLFCSPGSDQISWT